MVYRGGACGDGSGVLCVGVPVLTRSGGAVHRYKREHVEPDLEKIGTGEIKWTRGVPGVMSMCWNSMSSNVLGTSPYVAATPHAHVADPVLGRARACRGRPET